MTTRARIRTLSKLGALLLLTWAPLTAQAPTLPPRDLAELVPPDALLYVSFVGIDAAQAVGRSLAPYKLLQEKEMRHFLRHLMAQMEPLGDKLVGETPAEAMAAWRLGRRLAGRRVSLAVSGLLAPWDGDGPVPPPAAVLALDLGDDPASHEEAAKEVLGHLTGMAGLSEDTTEYDGHPISVLAIDGGGPPIQCTRIGRTLLFGIGDDLVRGCIDRARGRGEALSANAAFQRCRARCQTKPLIEGYFASRVALETFGSLIPTKAKESLTALGLLDVQAIYWASSAQAGVSTDVIAVDVPEPRRGLLAREPAAPISEALTKIPSTAVYAMATRVHIAGMFDTITTVLAGALPRSEREQMDEALAEVDAELGFSLRNDLLAALGEEIIAYVDMPTEVPIPAFVMSVEVADRAKAETLIATLIERSRGTLDRVRWQDHDIVAVKAPDPDAPYVPFYTFHENRLIVSLTMGGLRDALRHRGAPTASLLTSPAFEQGLKPGRMTLEGAYSVEFVDLPRLARFGADFAEQFLPSVPIPKGQVPLNFLELPSAEVLAKHVHPVVSITRGDSAGFLAESSGMGLADLVGLLALGLGNDDGELPLLALLVAAAKDVQQHRFEDGLVEVQPERTTPPPHTAPAEGPTDPAPEPSPRIINPVPPGDPREVGLRTELEALNAAIRATSEDPDLYFRRAIVHGQLRGYDAAIADYGRAREFGNESPIVDYNLACMLSLKGSAEEAVKALGRYFDSGARDWDLIDHDTDLDPLRQRADYKALIKRHRSSIR